MDDAKDVRDWPKPEVSVKQKMEDQTEFVGWWDENVRDKGKRENNADQRYFVEQAEDQTGITQPSPMPPTLGVPG